MMYHRNLVLSSLSRMELISLLLIFQAVSFASAQSPVPNVPFKIRYSVLTEDGPTAWLPLSEEPAVDHALMLNIEYQTELVNSPAQVSFSTEDL